MKFIIERKNYYDVGNIVLIEYWYDDMLTPVKILEKVGRGYKITHNIPNSKIQNAPDEIIKSSDILDIVK